MTEYAAELPSKKLVDLVDAISMNYTLALESTPEAHWRLIYRFEIPRLLGYERSVVATFDRSILISEVDRSFLAERGADRTKMAVVPNGTDLITAGGSGEMSEDMDVLFHGNMVTQANRAAAMYFLQDVLPLLRQSGSSPGVYIVGTSPSAKLRNMADGQNIRVTGEVADVTRYLLRSKVVVAPMVFGAGVQNKILEAMAVGKPVVTTSLGAEGIDGRSGEHFIVADSPAEFAAATKRLLEDPALRASLGMAGRKLIREKYTWDTSGRRLLEEVASVLPSPTLQYRDSHFTKGVSS
jgi:glycosyltransferase involved in cell wall biosynthesis